MANFKVILKKDSIINKQKVNAGTQIAFGSLPTSITLEKLILCILTKKADFVLSEDDRKEEAKSRVNNR